jgi:polyferredoxin
MGKLNKLLPLLAFALFAAIGAGLIFATGKPFYLLNFGYIGAFLSIGLFLMSRKSKHARRVVQLGVGLYMLVGLGVFGRENMQIEGFWYYLFSGLFQAAVIHYLVAKIVGPLIFGRGWCGWACWTAAVLDFLPYKKPETPRRKRLGVLRYIVFAVSLAFVGALFLFKVQDLEMVMLWSFIAGNLFYYAAGIALAFALRDNRAFCKYLCPITVFLKPASYFALFRIKPKPDKCRPLRHMRARLPDGRRGLKPCAEPQKRDGVHICHECVKACPKKAF